MSEGFHAKMSQLARRKEVSMSSYAESSSVPIKAVLSGPFIPEDNGLRLAIRVQLGPECLVIGGYLKLVLREVLCRLCN